MEGIKSFFENIDEVLMNYWAHISYFFQQEMYTIYCGIFIIIALLSIVGLIVSLKKFPKLFLFILIIVAIFCSISYLMIYK